MIEGELVKIWQSSNNQERVKFEKSKLIIELQSSLGRLHRWWKFLELVEVISVIIGILSFVFVAYWVPFTASKIASVLIIIFLINILIRVLGINKFRPSDFEENYLEYLKKTRQYLEVQKKLLETSVYLGNSAHISNTSALSYRFLADTCKALFNRHSLSGCRRVGSLWVFFE